MVWSLDMLLIHESWLIRLWSREIETHGSIIDTLPIGCNILRVMDWWWNCLISHFVDTYFPTEAKSSKKRPGHGRVCLHIYADSKFPVQIKIEMGERDVRSPKIWVTWKHNVGYDCNTFKHLIGKCGKQHEFGWILISWNSPREDLNSSALFWQKATCEIIP